MLRGGVGAQPAPEGPGQDGFFGEANLSERRLGGNKDLGFLGKNGVEEPGNFLLFKDCWKWQFHKPKVFLRNIAHSVLITGSQMFNLLPI